MLRHSMRSVTIILLSRYAKERAVLGLKTIHRDLPKEMQDRVVEIYEEMTPSIHGDAVRKIASLLENEFDWIREELYEGEVVSFMGLMIGKVLRGKRRYSMKTIRFLCLLLVIFSSLGMAGMFMDEPIVPIAVNYVVIFVLSFSIATLAPNRHIRTH
ncbi:MAG: hypothetical protein ACQEWI_08145 [Bacillota bacterium]